MNKQPAVTSDVLLQVIGMKEVELFLLKAQVENLTKQLKEHRAESRERPNAQHLTPNAQPAGQSSL